MDILEEIVQIAQDAHLENRLERIHALSAPRTEEKASDDLRIGQIVIPPATEELKH